MSRKKKLILAIVLIVFVILVTVISALSGDNIELETDDDLSDVKTWKVTKSTGLYESTNADSAMIMSLSVGTRVKSTRASGNLTCLINEEGMELCRVEVVETGDEGWVLRKWID
jgi:hypothetical protein